MPCYNSVTKLKIQLYLMRHSITSSKPEEEVKGGHTVSLTGMTASSPVIEEYSSPINMFILLDHDFIAEVSCGNDDRKIYESYLRFTREIVSVYHGKHSKDEIRSALIIAEDHLSILLEDISEGSEVAIKFVGRAINFLKKYIQSIAEWFAANGMAEKKQIVSESERATAYEFNFNGEFTEFVELVDSLLEYECFDSINDGTLKDSLFIRVMLDLFGFRHKTVQHFRAARNKIFNKLPKDGKGRCKLLPSLLKNIEDIWEKKCLKIR